MNTEQLGVDLIASGFLKAQGKYLNQFFGLTCSSDLLAAKLFPNAKEMTESMAAFHAARNRLVPKFDLRDPTVKVFCVGDGVSPRTAALFAYRSKWECWAIDPALRVDRAYDVRNVHLVRKKVEDFSIDCEKAIIVCVHSHATLDACLKSIRAPQRAVIAMPCCVSLEIPGRNPNFTKNDRGVWSPHRTVKTWVQV